MRTTRGIIFAILCLSIGIYPIAYLLADGKFGGGIQIQTQRWGVFVWRKTSAGVA